MNLNELKKMIAEEYSHYMKEQGAPPVPGVPTGMPTPEPTIAVSGDDVNAMGGYPEATLRQIYDMLKDYFEGEDTGATAGAAAAADGVATPPLPTGATDTDDEDDADDADDADDDVSEEKEDDKKDKKESKKDKKDLQERFQKLANIIK